MDAVLVLGMDLVKKCSVVGVYHFKVRGVVLANTVECPTVTHCSLNPFKSSKISGLSQLCTSIMCHVSLGYEGDLFFTRVWSAPLLSN